MKILTANVNSDGHLELLVEFNRTVTVRDSAIIPNRRFLITNQGQKNLETVSDDDYTAQAIESLRARCEDAPDVVPAAAAAAAALVGQVITKKP